MEKFIQHRGVAAAILRNNVDTDAIIPSREMKRVSKHGLGEGLFAGWRYTAPGGRELQPDFVLNRPEYSGCSILLSGKNFGCGSSREHAVWALKEYGIKVIIAEGFGSIFYNNCVRNGILPVVLKPAEITALAAYVEADPVNNQPVIDLASQTVLLGDSDVFNFDIESAAKAMLLEGLDPIAMTLLLDDKIAAYEAKQLAEHRWRFSGLQE